MPDLTVHVPDIGDFENVAVIEVLVSAGDAIEAEQSLVTLESDKATMEIPAPRAGVVKQVLVSVDDTVSEGSAIVVLELAGGAAEAPAAKEGPGAVAEGPSPEETPGPEAVAAGAEGADAAPAPDSRPVTGDHAEVLVIGSGPGGYTAAFRAADLGKRVVLVERHAELGGVCLNVGCIPSKALLHVAEVIAEAEAMAEHGVDFGGPPKLDFAKLRAHKDRVVGTLTGGLAKLAKARKVEVVRGTAQFASSHSVEIAGEAGARTISFDHAIIAVGSRSVELPGFPHDDPRVLDSTSALEVDGEARRLLVIGGGIIGLEMAAVYDALGSEVSVVELLPQLLTGVDKDLVRPLQKRIAGRYADIWLGTKVTRIEPLAEGLRVHFEGAKAPDHALFDRVLVAVGRRPNGDRIAAEKAGVRVDERGFIPVDAERRTNLPHVFAIGDVTGEPQLAHKATHEGKTAAEVIAGLPASFDPKAIPAVAYTDPEVAWTGLSETAAKAQGIDVLKASFPWQASGRALGIARTEGLTKLLFSKETGRVVGAGIVGRNAGELIAEATLAIELGADAEDLALTIHAHPTLSETVAFSAEVAAGTITDLYLPRRRR